MLELPDEAECFQMRLKMPAVFGVLAGPAAGEGPGAGAARLGGGGGAGEEVTVGMLRLEMDKIASTRSCFALLCVSRCCDRDER